MGNKLDDSSLDIIFREARSFNGYIDRPVTEQDCLAIWDLMKWGPTSVNQLPARLIWCRSDEAKQKLADCTTGTNPSKVRNAPVAVIIGMDSNFHTNLPELFPHVDAKAWFEGSVTLREESAFRNSTLQGAYFIIAARALGFDTGPISGFNNAAVDAKFFNDDAGVKSNFILTLGYGNQETIFARLPRPEFARYNRFE